MSRRVLILIIIMLIAACSANLERNDDGSWRFEVTFTEQAIAKEVIRAIQEPGIRNMEIDLRSGYILVAGESKRANGNKIDDMSFKLTLGVSGEHLTAVITDATLNNLPIEQSRVDKWNSSIATNLEKGAKERENSTLVQVITSEDKVTFVYRIEAKQ